jgi:molybdate transport system ATP-binding protein
MHLNVQFECAPGELVALVGPSGSGKTSVLRAIAGLLKTPTLNGQIGVNDTLWFDRSRDKKASTNLSPQERRVGLVFQNYALFPHLSAIQNIAISAGNTSATSINDAFQRLGLMGLENRLPSELSGGQQQRVALARALARNPAVLLLDEPFSAVDAPSRASLYRELANLRSSVSTPMVLVTHDLQEARRLADRVVILDAGDTLQSGTPEQIFSRPRNARVAELVGIQNHFQGRFFTHTTTDDEGLGRLDWHGYKLKVIDKNKIEDTAQINWVLNAEHADVTKMASLDATCAQSLPDNTLHCQCLEVLSLGETSICTFAPLGWDGLQDARLTLTLSSAQVRNMDINSGDVKSNTVAVHLPPHSIHIMPRRELPE